MSRGLGNACCVSEAGPDVNPASGRGRPLGLLWDTLLDLYQGFTMVDLQVPIPTNGLCAFNERLLCQQAYLKAKL